MLGIINWHIHQSNYSRPLKRYKGGGNRQQAAHTSLTFAEEVGMQGAKAYLPRVYYARAGAEARAPAMHVSNPSAPLFCATP